MKIKSVKQKIDEYIKTRVDELLRERLKSTIKGTLGPMCEEYLENNLEGLLREAIEESLEELASEFDVNLEAPSKTSQPLNQVESNYTDDEDDVDVDDENPYLDSLCFEDEEEKISQSKKLLAFIHFYKDKHGEDAIPTSSVIHTHLGLGSLELSELYSELSSSGHIEREMGSSKRLVILRGLEDPSQFLTNPL